MPENWYKIDGLNFTDEIILVLRHPFLVLGRLTLICSREMISMHPFQIKPMMIRTAPALWIQEFFLLKKKPFIIVILTVLSCWRVWTITENYQWCQFGTALYLMNVLLYWQFTQHHPWDHVYSIFRKCTWDIYFE